MSEPQPYQDDAGPPAEYRFLYGPFAVSGLLLISTQFYTREVTEGYPERQTLWSGLLDPNWADVAMVSLLLAFGLVALAVCGAVRAVSTVALPVAVAVLALLGALMLMAKIGYSDPAPPFDDGGAMLVTLAWAGVLLGLVHAAHLVVWHRRRH